jgi:hypothetical protein
MEKLAYLTPAVRVLDLHMDGSFCTSAMEGNLEKTYDDIIDDGEEGL